MITSWSQDFHSISVERATYLLFGNFYSTALMIFAYKEQSRRNMYGPQVIRPRKTVLQTCLCNFSSAVHESFNIGFYCCLSYRNFCTTV